MPLKVLKLLFAVIVALGAVHGQSISLSMLKCKDFIELPKETIASLTVWLDGYYTDEEDAALYEPDKLKTKTEKLTAFCAQNPKIGVMAAAESVMAK